MGEQRTQQGNDIGMRPTGYASALKGCDVALQGCSDIIIVFLCPAIAAKLAETINPKVSRSFQLPDRLKKIHIWAN